MIWVIYGLSKGYAWDNYLCDTVALGRKSEETTDQWF
jgi:hypothetical protein